MQPARILLDMSTDTVFDRVSTLKRMALGSCRRIGVVVVFERPVLAEIW
jgi:hypothetical protein